MANYCKIILMLFLIVLSSNCAFAFQKNEPILINNIHATAEDPYVIEEYDISSDSANCIEIRNSENIIIRNNYVHNCNWSDPKDPYSWYKGYAVLVQDSKNVTIENNNLSENRIGIVAIDSDNVKILKNDIRKTIITRPIGCEFCTNSEIAHNYLLDNGNPDWFWVPGQRMIGIFVVASDDITIHDNTVIRSSSDGIGISGQVDGIAMKKGRPSDWTLISKNIKVYNNLILDNLELGIFLATIDKIEIFNNTIRDHLSGINLDFNVKNAKIYENKIIVWSGYPIGIAVSHNNHVYNNIGYCADCSLIDFPKFVVEIRDDPKRDGIKSNWAKIPYLPSSENLIENNKVYKLKNPLKETLLAKSKQTLEEKTFKEKGWFACEIEEGLLDPDCVKEEEAKGFQGMPREIFVFDPLMENFDDFVITKKETLIFQTILIIFILMLILIIVTIILKKTKKL